MVVSIGADRTVRIWQPTVGRMVRLSRLESPPLAVTWARSGASIAVACTDGHVRLIDPDTAVISRDIHALTAALGLASAPDGALVSAARPDVSSVSSSNAARLRGRERQAGLVSLTIEAGGDRSRPLVALFQPTACELRRAYSRSSSRLPRCRLGRGLEGDGCASASASPRRGFSGLGRETLAPVRDGRGFNHGDQGHLPH
jgi:hypothetical protein